MFNRKHSPIKISAVLCATSLSFTSLTGCLNTAPATDAQKTSENQTAPIVNTNILETSSQVSRYDWSTDRIIGQSGGFQTQAFKERVKASLQLPAVEQNEKQASTSGGFANEFAKNLPSAVDVNHLPNSPAVLNNTAYFLTASDSSSNFYALDQSGALQWELALHENNGRFIGTSPAFGSAGGKNILYAITDQGRIYAVDASNGIVQGFVDVTSDKFMYSSPFVVAGATDSVYVASQEGRVYKYTFNGSTFTQVYNTKIVNSSNTGKFSSSPVVLGNHVYVGSEEGKLYKLQESNGAVLSTLNLSEGVRSEGCQIKATLAIDTTLDAGLVPCGSYIFKVKLNSATNTGVSLTAQSTLLEVREQGLVFKPTRVLGPNINTRTLTSTTLLRDPPPDTNTFTIEQRFGFNANDFVRIEADSGSYYGTVKEITNTNEVTLIETEVIPLPSPSPNPFLVGGEKVSVQPFTVRPTPIPSSTPSPTPTPSTGADPVTQIVVTNVEGLQEGENLLFPTLPGAPTAQICSSTNTACNSSTTTNYAGIRQLTVLEAEAIGAKEQILYQLTFPGTQLGTLVSAELNTSRRFVPFEKVNNRVIGTANANNAIDLGSTAGFQSGQEVRITHPNGHLQGRYEYSTIASVSGNRLQLSRPLKDAPRAGARVEIIDQNPGAYGRLSLSNKFSSGNILSKPILRGNAQHMYVQHGNLIYELDYSNNNSFENSATYIVLQSGRLNHNNLNLTALSRSAPLVVGNDRLLAVDTDISGKTGIFMNRIFLPLSGTQEKLNDVFPIRTPNSLGDLPNRAETHPVLFGGSSVLFGGGNGIAYKLHKDMAW